MYVQTHGIYYSKISVLFWGDFPQKKIQSETWTHPPTSIVISNFCRKKILCKAPKQSLHLVRWCYNLALTRTISSGAAFMLSKEVQIIINDSEFNSRQNGIKLNFIQSAHQLCKNSNSSSWENIKLYFKQYPSNSKAI